MILLKPLKSNFIQFLEEGWTGQCVEYKVPRKLLLDTDQLVPPWLEKIGFERLEENEMDHAEEDRSILKEKEVVVEKEWQQFWNSSNRSTVDTMSVLINLILLQTKISIQMFKYNDTCQTICLNPLTRWNDIVIRVNSILNLLLYKWLTTIINIP